MGEYGSIAINAAVAVATAVLSAWLIDGGVQRRTRRTIREEIELRNLLEAESPHRDELDARVDRRLAGYLTPFRSRRSVRVLGTTAAVVTMGLFGWWLPLEDFNADAGKPASLWFTGGLAAMAGLLASAVQLLFRRAESVARQRQSDILVRAARANTAEWLRTRPRLDDDPES